MPPEFPVISPIDGQLWWTQPATSDLEVVKRLDKANQIKAKWASTPLSERLAMVERFANHLESKIEPYSEALSHQMGRPLSQCPGEIRGTLERTRAMAKLAQEALADIRPEPQAGFERFIQRVPVGVVLVLAPWNYPYLTAVNAIIPALLAGNCVLLKHSDQTPLVAQHFLECLKEAGCPEGVFDTIYIDHPSVGRLIGDSRINHVCFTGSVEGGKAVSRAVAARAQVGDFIHLGLELGGKDPAYVRSDADMDAAVAGLVDGAFFNSGQSCCGIERIYVHETAYASFVERFVEATLAYRLGNPLDAQTNLGPVVRVGNAHAIRNQIAQAIQMGAVQQISGEGFSQDDGTSAYMAPTVLTDVHHGMPFMRDETFGPTVGIMPVSTDEAAVALMNDSPYGLTASLWTRDDQQALALGQSLNAGTIFMNRCDYLDPMLAWTGRGASGRGATLSVVGFEHLTVPKSYHFRLP